MSDDVIKTQGTKLYIVDSTGSESKVVKFDCPTGITGLGAGAVSNIPTTCLDAKKADTSIGGLEAPGPMSAPFIFKPTKESHQGVLTSLKGLTTQFMVCMSDTTSAPTLDSNGDLDPPASGTSGWFSGYITEVSIDMAANDKVVGTMTIQRSGEIDWQFPA